MKIINYTYRIVKNEAAAYAIIATMACFALTVPICAETICKTESAHHSAVAMNTGDDLVITLEGNPTTGYLWEKEEGDDKIISLQGDYKYIPAQTRLTGSGGKFETFA